MENFYDVVIAGGGPGGLTAALYLARAKCRVLVLEKERYGGQIAITEEVTNYPGLARISGEGLSEIMRRQAESFGAEFAVAEVTGFELDRDVKVVRSNRGEYRCFGILLATGARPRSAGFRGEEQFRGRGVAYCATCDGALFQDRDVFVIGGGYAAAQESIFLTRFARHVTVLIRRDDFSCAASLAEEVRGHEKITVLANTVMEAISGDEGVNYARCRNRKTGETTEYHSREGETFGVFVFAGYVPATDFLQDVVALDGQGYILTDGEMRTSAEGVYAAGDVCVKPLRQIVTATADGALAASSLEKYVHKMRQKTGLRADPIRRSEDAVLFREMITKEDGILEALEQKLVLKLYLDSRPVSRELEDFATALAARWDKLRVQMADRGADGETAPRVEICREDGTETGLAFFGVPGGHELMSFMQGLCQAGGGGQKLDSWIRERIDGIQRAVDIKVLVTLSCPMCPDAVVAAQQIAARNARVTAHVYDVLHFEEIRKRYNVMSVPTLVINDSLISVGKKNVEQILDLIQQQGRRDSQKSLGFY